MADFKKPLDITWDDVRDSQKRRFKLKWVIFGVASLALIVAMINFLRIPQSQEQRDLQVALGQPLTPKAPAPSLCDRLRSWSENSSLDLGKETRQACDQR